MLGFKDCVCAPSDAEPSSHRVVLKHVLPLLLAALCVSLVTVPLLLFDRSFALSLVPIAYLVPVIIAATQWGIWSAIVASIAGVGAADFFFFTPLYSFRIDDPQEAVDLILFLVVALVSGNLAARLRRETEELRQREAEIHYLYEFSRRLASCFTVTDLTAVIQDYLRRTLGENTVFLIPTADGRLEPPDVEAIPVEVQSKAASMVATGHFATQLIQEPLNQNTWLLKSVYSGSVVHGIIAVNIGLGSGKFSEIRTRRVEAIVEEASSTIQRLDIGKAMEDARIHLQADRLRNAFLGALSHELRTPLAIIQGSASVLFSTSAVRDDRRIHSLVEAIAEEVAHLDDFIQNILNATRVTAGGLEPRFAWTDPQDVVHAALKQRARRLAAHTISIDLADNLPLAYADAALVAEAYGQLLENAAKYSPSGSTIAVATRMDRGKVVISVSDQGTGITMDEQSQLGKRSFRGQRHRGAIPGSGLGFWIASTFVRANAGTIEIKSQGKGRGTKASIILPVSEPSKRPLVTVPNE